MTPMTPIAPPDERDELVAEYDTGDYFSTVRAYVRESVFLGHWLMWCARGSRLLTTAVYPARSDAVAHARVFVAARRTEAQSAPTDGE